MADDKTAKLIDYLYGRSIAQAAMLEALCEVLSPKAKVRALNGLRDHVVYQRNFAEPRPVSEEYLQGIDECEAQLRDALSR